jgi:hypothetical protein
MYIFELMKSLLSVQVEIIGIFFCILVFPDFILYKNWSKFNIFYAGIYLTFIIVILGLKYLNIYNFDYFPFNLLIVTILPFIISKFLKFNFNKNN